MNRCCMLIVLAVTGCAVPVEKPPAGPEDDVEVVSEWEPDEEGGCPDSWVLVYSLKGRIDITHTPLNIGNADAEVGGLDSDELIIRIADDGGEPKRDQVLMTSFNLLQDFRVSVNMLGEIAIVTDLLSSSADECGIASGELIDNTITWDACDYGPEHGTPSWGPEEGAYGAGCINDYQVQGTLNCIDDAWLASCEDGWLREGINNIDDTYNQPFLDLVFATESLAQFTMTGMDYGAELPTNTNNRTWLTLYGERKSMTLEPTPDCLCME